MPVMDGLSLCGKLRQDLETCHIPIILLTAQPSTGLNFESFSQGADDYITKPFNISQLEARCRNLLENRQRMRRKYSRSIAGSDVVTTNDKDANSWQLPPKRSSAIFIRKTSTSKRCVAS